ncbi:hypothetical protein JW935_04950 [candidate division KSB1 bacterium]|nr:hypothetical protein [candidate division KSB1 bacterium]
MTVSFSEPFSRAWQRMKIALFKPFDLNKWFVFGFSAFLAGLSDGGGGNGGGRGNADWEEIAHAPQYARDWIFDHPEYIPLIFFIALVIVAIIIIVLWLSSRGKFMFLYNVVTDKAEIRKPWREYSAKGNSLFLWRTVFTMVVLAVIIAFVVRFFRLLTDYDEGVYYDFPVMAAVHLGLFVLLFFVLVAYISLYLDSFVVPIMYKNNLTTVQAFHHFLDLFRKSPGWFILYGLFVFLLWMCVIIMIIIAGFLTCCLGFLLLIIPYIGSVVTLPITYFFRAFSIEFLAQFGDEYRLLTDAEALTVKSE